jgi:hypothetical protein
MHKNKIKGKQNKKNINGNEKGQRKKKHEKIKNK